MQECGTGSGISVQGCGEFAVCSYIDLNVQERYLLGRVFKSKFDCGMEVVHEVFHGLELFGSAQNNQGEIAYESVPEGDGPDEDFLDGVFVMTHEEGGIQWGSFGSNGCTNELEKKACPSMKGCFSSGQFQVVF